MAPDDEQRRDAPASAEADPDDAARPQAEAGQVDAASADEAGAGAEPPRPELRAKDLLTRSRAEVEAELDPATLAELSSWFDRPSLEVVQEQLAEQQLGVDDVMAEWDRAMAQVQLVQRSGGATDHVDPAVQALLERHLHNARKMERAPFEVEAVIDESIVSPGVRRQLDQIIALAADASADHRELEPPPDVVDAIERHNVPQAILRDLARPEGEFEIRFESPFDEDEVGIVDTAREIAEALAWRPEVPEQPRFTEVARDSAARFRAITSEPWADHHKAARVWRGKTEEP